jgi:hypothetical protein
MEQPSDPAIAKVMIIHTSDPRPQQLFDSATPRMTTSPSDTGSAIGARGCREAGREGPLKRSRRGCWTCRKRRVKCDEGHPTCGPCTRLHRDCHYDHSWKFNNLIMRIRRQHDHVTTLGSPIWDQRMHSLTSKAAAGRSTQMGFPTSGDSTQGCDPETGSLSCPSKFFNSILTPHSFAKLPEYGGPVEHHDRDSPVSENSQDASTNGSDYTMLSKFEETPYAESFSSPPEQSSRVSGDLAQTKHVPLDSDTYGPVDYLLYYKEFISPRIMPVEARQTFSAGSGAGEVVLSLSKTFEPVSLSSRTNPPRRQTISLSVNLSLFDI